MPVPCADPPIDKACLPDTGVEPATGNMRATRRMQQDQQRAAKRLHRLDPACTTTFLVVRHGETDWNLEHRLQGRMDVGLNQTGHMQAAKLAEYFAARQAALLSPPPPPEAAHQPEPSPTTGPLDSRALDDFQDAASQQPAQQPSSVQLLQSDTLQRLPPVSNPLLDETLHGPHASGKRHVACPLEPQPVAAVWSSDLARAMQTATAIGNSLKLQVQPSPQLRERCLGVLQGLTLSEARTHAPEAWAALTARRPAYASALTPHGVEGMQELQTRVVEAVQALADTHAGQTVVIVCHGGVMSALYAHAQGGQAPARPARNGSVHVLAVQGSDWVVVDWEGDAAGTAGQEGFGGGREGG